MTNKTAGTSLMFMSMFLLWGLVGGIETLPPDAGDWQMFMLMAMSVLAAVLGILGMSLVRMDTYPVV